MISMLGDLDELVLQCRDGQARLRLAESVACYRVGGYRASIVAAWIAVVFDFIHKLQEMDLAGNAEASVQLRRLEAIQTSNDMAGALAFERDVLELAEEKFELISPSERKDLARMLEDRHRCAHPSLSRPLEPYEPTAELARYHLRNAVTHLLAHPPVQGTGAINFVWNELKSSYFPTDPTLAENHLRSGPLGRARGTLVRGVTLGLSKALLKDTLARGERERYFAALVATQRLYPAVGESVLRVELPKVLTAVSDADWWRTILYLSRVPIAWEAIGEPMREKSRLFIKDLNAHGTEGRALLDALEVPALRDIAVPRLGSLTAPELAAAVAERPRTEFCEAALRKLERVGSYSAAVAVLTPLVSPLIEYFDVPGLAKLISIFLANDQVRHAWPTPELFSDVYRVRGSVLAELKDEWLKFYRVTTGDAYLADSDTMKSLMALIEGAFPFETNAIKSGTAAAM